MEVALKDKPQPDGEEAYKSGGLTVNQLVTMFEDAEEASDTPRKLAERDRDYYDGKQLTSAEKAELAKRGQPDLIFNVIGPKIDYLTGLEALNRTDPRGFPKTPQDEDAAEACTDALRFIKDDCGLDQAFSLAWEHLLIEGYGGIELTVEDTGNGDIAINALGWDWDRLFFDPHSRKPDFSDARYVGGIVWMDSEDAKAKWPDAAEAIGQMVAKEAASSVSGTFDDRPRWKKWTMGTDRKRVRIVQMYHRDENGQWHWCHFTQAGKLDGGKVEFVDKKKRSWCPLIMQSAYVDRDNARYGLVRIMISPQDETNKRRSKLLHRTMVRNVRTERGAVDDVDAAKNELAKADGWIETNPGYAFEILENQDQTVVEFQLLQDATNRIEMIGPNAAMLGKGPDAASGRAILANQQGGQTELTRLLDRHRHLKERIYVGAWDLIRQYKTAEWWVRVTDDEKNVKFVGFNRPLTMAEKMQRDMEKQGATPEQIANHMQQAMADPMQAAAMQQVVGMENVPAEMNMDISLEEVPDVANIAEEQFQALVKLAPAVTFPPQVYIKASSLRSKQELLDLLDEQSNDPQAQQLQAEQIRLQMEKAMAEIEKIKAEIEKSRATAVKTLVEADMMDAQAGAIQIPQQVPPNGQAADMSQSVPPPGFPGADAMPPPG